MTPVHLALLTRWGFKSHAGLMARGAATGVYIVAQNRLLTFIPPATKLSVEHLTVEHASLKALVHIRLERIELARLKRPPLIAELIRMGQALAPCLAITAQTVRPIGNAEPWTGSVANREPFLHIDHGRSPSLTTYPSRY
jgi:hypothetical protein